MSIPLRALALLAATAATASATPLVVGPVPPPPHDDVPAYLDGGRRVEVRPGSHDVDPGLTAVLLRYPDGRTVRAAIDDTAIVVTPAIDRLEREEGLARVELLLRDEGMWLVRGRAGESGVDVAARLASRVGADDVRLAMPNLHLARTLHEARVNDDPRYAGQWFFDDLDLRSAWGLEWGSADVGVAVIDTGCDPAHEDLADKFDEGVDVVNGDRDPSILSSEPGAAHGTSCAGLVAASTDNGKGVAGACPGCRMRCVRLIPVPRAYVGISRDVGAFQFVIDSGVAVASNSWGFEEYVPAPEPLAMAIDAAFRRGRGGKGTVIVFAAGNEDREVLPDEILGLPAVLAVGAVTHYQEVTSYSNRGAPVDLMAPVGTVTTDISGIYGDEPGDYTTSFGGTSAACPIVAGIAGLVASAAPEKTAEEITNLLVENVAPALYAVPDENGHDAWYGYGIVDPVRALKAAKGIVDPPDAGTPTTPPVREEKPPRESGSGGDVGGCGCASGGPGAALALVTLAAALRRLRVRARASARPPA